MTLLNFHIRFVRSLLVVILFTLSQQSVFAQPSITSFTPATGTVGTLVTITGANLINPTTVTIGGANAISISNDGSTLVAMVMSGAGTGNVVVTTAAGTAISSGSFVTQKSGYTFSQQGNKLYGNGAVTGGRQGQSVAISADGNTAVIGAPSDNSLTGAVFVFTRSGGVWTQQGVKLVGSGATGAAQQGYSVAISADGNTILSGGTADNSNMGAVWVFTRTGGVWTQEGNKLVGTGAAQGYTASEGSSVALSADGNTAAFGGYDLGGSQGGAWVFTRSGGVWTQQGNKLFGSGAIMNTAGQGYSIALSADGNTLLVGGYEDGWAYGTAIGAAWVFSRTGGVWTQQGAKLVATGYTPGNVAQGGSVALSADGNTAVIGGYRENNSMGAAWIWTRSGSIWTQNSKLVGTGGSGSPEQGHSVAISGDGNTVLIGGWQDANIIGGGMWVFKRSGSTWTQQGTRVNGTGNSGGPFQGSGLALSADGSTAIMGGFGDGSFSGASWVFTTAPVPLPLNWLSIDAQIISKQEIKVSWSSSEEINTSYFEVQRSTGNASDKFIAIGTVTATSRALINNYQFTDNYAFADGEYYYYRIKQVDADGRFTYSTTKRVKFNSNQQTIGWQVYPNPVRKNEAINITATGGNVKPGDLIRIQLTNTMGQVLYDVKDVANSAASHITQQVKILSAGTYTITITHQNDKQSVRIIVQQ